MFTEDLSAQVPSYITREGERGVIGADGSGPEMEVRKRGGQYIIGLLLTHVWR